MNSSTKSLGYARQSRQCLVLHERLAIVRLNPGLATSGAKPHNRVMPVILGLRPGNPFPVDGSGLLGNPATDFKFRQGIHALRARNRD